MLLLNMINNFYFSKRFINNKMALFSGEASSADTETSIAAADESSRTTTSSSTTTTTDSEDMDDGGTDGEDRQQKSAQSAISTTLSSPRPDSNAADAVANAPGTRIADLDRLILSINIYTIIYCCKKVKIISKTK